jgi:hypothetical protein
MGFLSQTVYRTRPLPSSPEFPAAGLATASQCGRASVYADLLNKRFGFFDGLYYSIISFNSRERKNLARKETMISGGALASSFPDDYGGTLRRPHRRLASKEIPSPRVERAGEGPLPVRFGHQNQWMRTAR